MNTKKGLILAFLLVGFWGCFCPKVESHWNIGSFVTSFYDKQGQAVEDGQIKGDSVRLLVTFVPVFVTNEPNFSNPFIPSVLALSCPYPGDEGMEDYMVDFILFSDKTFNGIPAGESLNDMFVTNNKWTIAEWIWHTKDYPFQNGYQHSEFIFTQTPEKMIPHTFTLRFVLNSGKILEGSSEAIMWK
ncbi:MAG: hypothetical protein WAT79_03070 [Saprospiraceae bacterium]